MMPSPTDRRFVVTILVAAVFFAGSGWAAGGSDTAPRAFGSDSPLIIPAAAFATTGFTPDSFVFNSTGYLIGTSSYGCVRAPVHLPHGAEVTRLTASLVDQSSDSDMSVSLVRTTNDAFASSTEMARVTSNGFTASPITNFYQDSTVTVPHVEYPDYGYYVHACLPDYDFRLYQVEIEYVDHVIFRDGLESGSVAGWSSATGTTSARAPSDRTDLDLPAPGGIDPRFKSQPYVSPLSIPPSEFKPDGIDLGEVFISFVDGVMYGANYDHSRFMHAPVWLPDGATITQVTARVVDNDGGGGGAANCASGTPSDIKLWLYRSKGCSGSSCWDEMASASTSGSSSGIQFLTPATVDFPTVDGDQYGYFVVMRLCGPKHEVYGVRISYTEP